MTLVWGHMHWSSQKCLEVMIIMVFHCPKCCLPALYLFNKCLEDTKAKSVEVVGYWMTLDITTLQYEAQNQLITLKPGRDAPSIGKKGNETAAILEKLVNFFVFNILQPLLEYWIWWTKFGFKLVNQSTRTATLSCLEHNLPPICSYNHSSGLSKLNLTSSITFCDKLKNWFLKILCWNYSEKLLNDPLCL